jgi:gas vesicle protein
MSVTIETRAKDDIHKTRERIHQLMNQLKTDGQNQSERIESRIRKLSHSIEKRREKFRNDIQKQRERISFQLKNLRNNVPEVRTALENEIKRLDEMLSKENIFGSSSTTLTPDPNPVIVTQNQTDFVPKVRGLGDGYGRHL